MYLVIVCEQPWDGLEAVVAFNDLPVSLITVRELLAGAPCYMHTLLAAFETQVWLKEAPPLLSQVLRDELKFSIAMLKKRQLRPDSEAGVAGGDDGSDQRWVDQVRALLPR